jgi:hypothetical protein
MRKKLPLEVLKFFKREGSKGGKIGGKRRAVALTSEQRTAIAKKAAVARWAQVTQTDLKKQVTLQAAEWESDRAAQAGAADIRERLENGAELKTGKLTFDRKTMRTETTKATKPPKRK